MQGQLLVELVGDLVLARVRGEPTADTLEMEPPPVDVPLAQQQLDQALGATKLRRAIVVPYSRLAYLARLAFGEGNTAFSTTTSSRP